MQKRTVFEKVHTLIVLSALGGTVCSSSVFAIPTPPRPTKHLDRAFERVGNLQVDGAVQELCLPLIVASRDKLSSTEARSRLARFYALIGRTLAVDDNLPAAGQCFLIATRLDPSNRAYRAYLADAWMRSGRDKDSIDIFRQVEKDAAQDLISARTYCRYLLRQESIQDATVQIANAMKLKDASSDWRMHYLLGRIQARRGYTKKGAAEIIKAAEMCNDKYSKELLLALANALQQDKVQQQEHLNRAGQIFPDDPLWRTNLAQAVGDKPGIVNSQMQETLKARRVVPKAIFAFGNDALRQNQLQRAKQSLSHLQMVAPWHELTLQLDAKIAKRENRFEDVAKIYEQFIVTHPHSAPTYISAADFFNERKEHERAVRVLKLGSENVPGCPGIWRRLGDSYFFISKENEAKAAYEKALTLLPTDSANLNEVANAELSSTYAGLGAYYYGRDEREKALEFAEMSNKTKFIPVLPWYLSLMQIRPGRIEWRNYPKKEQREAAKHALLGDMMRFKRIKDCITEYRKAADLDPDEVNYHTYLLDALSEAGDWAGAASEDWQASSKIVNRLPSQIGNLFTKKEPAKEQGTPKADVNK